MKGHENTRRKTTTTSACDASFNSSHRWRNPPSVEACIGAHPASLKGGKYASDRYRVEADSSLLLMNKTLLPDIDHHPSLVVTSEPHGISIETAHGNLGDCLTKPLKIRRSIGLAVC
jgi:hypothetical protein